MVRQSITYNDFSFGEISKNLFGRGNINAYRNSAMNITNMNVLQVGGIERRSGLKFVADVHENGKIVAFEYSSDKQFLLFFGDEYIDIYDDQGEVVETLSSPYKLSQLSQIRWSQKGQDMYIVHPEVAPRIIRFFETEDVWNMTACAYDENPEYHYTCQPYAKFEDTDGITLIPSAVTGDDITVQASEPLSSSSYVGESLLINGGEVFIKLLVSSELVRASVSVNLNSVSPDSDWQEPVFSKKRGYPSSIAFYQNRLVLGGTKSFKNRLWFSQIEKYFNFDLGSGLDDEAIELDIFSDKVNQIVSLFAEKHLLVFTSDSEWVVMGSPITPSNIVVQQQTKIGSVTNRYISPKFVEGSTIFVARNKKEIREFFCGDLSDSYMSEDLILLSSHLLNNPIDQDYNVKQRMLYVVEDDGSVAVLLTNKAHNTNAWVKYETDGKILSLAVLLDKVYVVVERGENYSLEVFDENFNLDCASEFVFEEEVSTVSDLYFLDDRDITVVADGKVYELTVGDGEISLPEPAKHIIVGLPFTHLFCPLPVFVGSSYIPKAVRLLELNLRLIDTGYLQVDTGSGLKTISLGVDNFSGDVKVRGKGFIKNYQVPLFKVQSSEPYKVKILNISMLIDVIK